MRILSAAGSAHRLGPSPKAVLAAVGCVTLLGQVLLLRELLIASFGSELSYLAGLALLLAGTAAGAALGRRLAHSADAVGWMLLVLAGALPLLISFSRCQRALLGSLPGTVQAPALQVAMLSLTLLPFGLLGGALFAASARLHLARGGTGGSAYAWESAGGAVGGVAGTALSALGLSGVAGALLATLPASAVAALLPGKALRRVLAGAAALLALCLLPSADRLDVALASWRHPGVSRVVETPYGRLQIERAGEQVSFFTNGALVCETQGTSAEEFVHPSALQVLTPRRVLLVGGALEGVPCEVLKHRPESVDLIELDGRALRAAEPYMPAAWRAALSAPSLHLQVADARRAILSGGPWDLILVGMAEPDSGLTNRYYTQEFFRACAAKLAPGGVLALRMHGSENLWTPLWVQRTASVDAALGRALPYRWALPGPTLLLLASREPLCHDPARLVERWRARAIQARSISPPSLRYLVTNDRVEALRAQFDRLSPAPNSDARPVCYPSTLALWAARLAPGLSHLEMPAPLPTGVLLLSALLLAAGLAGSGFFLRGHPGAGALLLAAGAGAGGMTLEGALLLAYQVRCGALYQDIGLLLTAFMAGLAVGAWLGAHPEAPRVRLLSLALLGLCASAAALLWSTTLWPGLLATLALMLGAGGATGALFASAAAGRPPESIGALYASDLVGGLLGASLSGLYLIPFAGLPWTALLVVLLSAALVAVSPLRESAPPCHNIPKRRPA